MPIGITEEHEPLRQAVRRFVETRITPAVVRAALDSEHETLPEFWDALTGTGWLEADVLAQAVIVEELGRACAPGPYVPTAIVAALTPLKEGETASVVLDDGGLAVSGHLVDTILSPNNGTWSTAPASAQEVTSIDLTRRLGKVQSAENGSAVDVTTEQVRAVAAVLYSAEAIGIAQWCVDTASDYAKNRVQFGRPIGQFQGVKHRCAEMLARTELARAAVWDAARAVEDLNDEGSVIAIGAAAALAFDAAFFNAKDCVQTLGGIGFTWEHVLHRYYKRALEIQAFGGYPRFYRAKVAASLLDG